MTITEPTVIAHPADLPRAAKFAVDRQLPLQLSDLIPRGQAVVVDPSKLPLIGGPDEPAPEHR